MNNSHEKERHYVRLNIHERVQHHCTWTTFVVLAVSGFMLELPEQWVVLLGSYRESVFYWRGLLHRTFAVIMIANLFYQTWYTTCTRAGRELIKDMLPGFQDSIDMFQNMLYYLRLSDKKPLFDRFNYKEKMEYWTGWIGNIIITITGAILWIEYVFPKFIFDVSILVHTMEAILASCAIMVWHFYEVHFKPGKFPMSKIFLDGLIPEHELKEEHPLQYERIIKTENAPVVSDS
jgi:cytochrome b subunit of formate dehydrogenase